MSGWQACLLWSPPQVAWRSGTATPEDLGLGGGDSTAGFAPQNLGRCSLCKPDIACSLPGERGGGLCLLRALSHTAVSVDVWGWGRLASLEVTPVSAPQGLFWVCSLPPDPRGRAPARTGLRDAPLVGLVRVAVGRSAAHGRETRGWQSGAALGATCHSLPLPRREGAQLLVLQPRLQHARAGPPGRPHAHPHQRHTGPRVLLRPGDADVRLPRALGWEGPKASPQHWGSGSHGGHPLPPALSQSLWKTHTSSTSTRSGWGLSPKDLTEPS